MIILANFLHGISVVLGMVLTFAIILIFARVILSWVNPDPFNPIVRFLNSSTDPLFNMIRRKIPLSFGGMDFSPILVLFIIYFLQAFLVQTIDDYATMIKLNSMGGFKLK